VAGTGVVKTEEVSAARANLFAELEMLGRLAWSITKLETMVRAQITVLDEQEDS
jgi:hypothetical protein